MKSQERIKNFSRERFSAEYYIFKNELLSFINAEIYRNKSSFVYFFKIVNVIEELDNAILRAIEAKWSDKKLQKLKQL